MHHIAIMRKSWGLLEKIVAGEKTAESRWYKTPRPPWNKIQTGDTIWFKNTGEPVTVKAKVTRIIQFGNLTPEKTKEILEKYGGNDLGIQNSHCHSVLDTESIQINTNLIDSRFPACRQAWRGNDRVVSAEIDEYFSGKNYCVIAFFDQVEKVKPFNINKTGFGAMSAWMRVENIEKITI